MQTAPFSRLRLSLVTGSLAALLVLSGCSPAEEQKAETVIRPVKVVEVSLGNEGRTRIYSGSVKARTEMNLGFRVAGKIVNRDVDIGDRVAPGQVLMQLDSADLKLALDKARADLAAAEQSLKTARTELDRTETLRKQDIVAQSSLDQRKLAYEQAVATRNAAQSGFDQASNQLSYAKLGADQAGVVTAVNADIGQVIAAGAPAVSVAVDGEREVLIAVPETDISAFTVGGKVETTFYANRDTRLDGEVREIAASADPASRTFAVKIRLPEDPDVRIGMTATVAVHIANPDTAITLPVAALTEKDGKPIVWLVDPKTETVSSTVVTVSGYADNGVRISAGVKPGDLVVAAGTQFMTDDLKVRPTGADTALAVAGKS